MKWADLLFLSSLLLTLFAFFNQVCAFVGHLGRMAASANTFRTMQINLEKKCADLEVQLSLKKKALDTTVEKLRTAEEKVASGCREGLAVRRPDFLPTSQ